MSKQRRGIPSGRLVGLGVELAGIILAGMALGYLLDVTVLNQPQPWGLIVGCLLGFAAGMANIVRISRNI